MKKRRILVAAPFAIFTPHLETDLEIIQNHLDVGDEVTVLFCNASMITCEANIDHKFSTCMKCVGRMKAGLDKLSGRVTVRSILNLSKLDKNEINSVNTEYVNIDELKSVYIDNFDVGWAVTSTLISIVRDPEPNLRVDRNKWIIKNYIQNSIAIYRSVRNYLRDMNYDEVYVFNGRAASLRAVFRASRAECVKRFTHDRGRNFKHYELYENSIPHDIQKREATIRLPWDAADDATREEVGSKFFEERSMSLKQSWVSFTEYQTKGALPDGWSNTKENIVIFTSSEDEFASIGDEWRNELYESQVLALGKIVPDIARHSDIQLYIRIHPNLKNVNNRHVKSILEMKSPNLVIIQPDSPVDSYSLLKDADKVLTFGSTMGIEAVYWGRPSILAGMCFYKNLGGTYNPSSHDEVVKLLLDKTLRKKNKVSALMYGYYQNTRRRRAALARGAERATRDFKGDEIAPLNKYRMMIKYLKKFDGILGRISLRVNNYRMGIGKNKSIRG